MPDRAFDFRGRAERQKKQRELEAALRARGWKVYQDIAAEIVDMPNERRSQSVVANALMAMIRSAIAGNEFGGADVRSVGRKTYLSEEAAVKIRERALKQL